MPKCSNDEKFTLGFSFFVRAEHVSCPSQLPYLFSNAEAPPKQILL